MEYKNGKLILDGSEENKLLYRGKMLSLTELIVELQKHERLAELQGDQADWALRYRIPDKPKRWTTEEIRELEDRILDKIEGEEGE